nr:probable fructokinase-1 [Tanacetum cinerariifolium]
MNAPLRSTCVDILLVRDETDLIVLNMFVEASVEPVKTLKTPKHHNQCRGTQLCKIVDASTQWEPYSMLAATFSARHNVCNTLYRGTKLCKIVDASTQWEPHSMLAATFSGRYNVCNTLYREIKFQRRHFLNQEAHKQIMTIWDKAKVIKVSDNELEFLTGSDKIDDETAMYLWHPNLKLLLVTLTKVAITILRYRSCEVNIGMLFHTLEYARSSYCNNVWSKEQVQQPE